MLIILFVGDLPRPPLRRWYRDLGTSAFAMDVLSMYVCVLSAYRMVPVQHVPLTVLAIQLSHDVSFGYLVRSIPRGSMTVLDMFFDYARPAILVYDAIIVLSVLAVDWVLRTRPMTHTPSWVPYARTLV